MTKKAIFEEAQSILEKHKIKGEAKDAILELLEPKKGGQAIDLESIVKRDASGDIVEVKCKLSGVFLPATEDFFYADKGSKIVTADGFECSRTSKQAKALKREASKIYKASKDAIMSDVLEGKITPEDGKEALADISPEPDYSLVSADLPTEAEEA